MLFFAKLLIISQIVISNPTTLKIRITSLKSAFYTNFRIF